MPHATSSDSNPTTPNGINVNGSRAATNGQNGSGNGSTGQPRPPLDPRHSSIQTTPPPYYNRDASPPRPAYYNGRATPPRQTSPQPRSLSHDGQSGRRSVCLGRSQQQQPAAPPVFPPHVVVAAQRRAGAGEPQILNNPPAAALFPNLQDLRGRQQPSGPGNTGR
jgi:hypothetical protein